MHPEFMERRRGWRKTKRSQGRAHPDMRTSGLKLLIKTSSRTFVLPNGRSMKRRMSTFIKIRALRGPEKERKEAGGVIPTVSFNFSTSSAWRSRQEEKKKLKGTERNKKRGPRKFRA